MRRGITLAILLVVVAAGALLLKAPSNSPQASGPETQSALRQLLDAGNIPQLRWPDFQDPSHSLSSVYEENHYQPLWISSGKLTPKGQAILDALQLSTTKGLDPQDYDVLLLTEWAHRLQASPGVEARQVATLDVSLTVELMRYAAALHQGRIDPHQVRFAIRPKGHLDPAAFVRQYAGAPNQSLLEELAQVEPPFAGYRNTVATLVHYRQLAAREPPQMPPQPRLPFRSGDTYLDLPALAARLEFLGDLPPQPHAPTERHVYEGQVLEAMKRFQARHGLSSTGTVDLATWRAFTTPASQRAEQLALTLERWRWMPSTVRPAIVVNIPEFTLRAYDERGQPVLRMRVIVGKAYRRRTPAFEDSLESIIVRPWWNVPFSIQRGEMVPHIRRDPGYLEKNDLQIIGRSNQPVPCDAQESVVSGLASGHLRLRQRPGPKNSLGLLKFDFPNDYSVYMHGTPAHQLFSLARRDFSHGCIRVEDPEALAAWVLRDDPNWDRAKIAAATQGDQTIRIALRHPVAVLVLYGTALVEENGEVHFFDDIYGYDAELRKALAGRNRPCPSCP